MKKVITSRLAHAFAIGHLFLWLVIALTINQPAGGLTSLLFPVYVVLYTLDFPLLILSASISSEIVRGMSHASYQIANGGLFFLLGYVQWFLLGWGLNSLIVWFKRAD